MAGVEEEGAWFRPAEPVVEAKLFKSGGSQAVRLPKEFRFEGDRVSIRREGARVILEPMRKFKTEQEVLDWLETIRIPDFMPHGRLQDDISEMSPIMREWLNEKD